jgi:hypothetical protein
MDLNLLLGTTSVLGMGAGVWALVLHRKNGNGHALPQPVEPWQTAQLAETLQPLAMLPHQLEASFAHFLEALAPAEPEPEPEPAFWPGRITDRLEEIRNLLAVEPLWPDELRKTIERLGAVLEERATVPAPDIERTLELLARVQPPPPPQRPDPTAGLVRALEELPARLVDMLAAERNRRLTSGNVNTTSGPAGGGEAGGGSGGSPPSRRVAPALPRLPPTTLPPSPSIPAAYVAGSVWVPAQVANLLELIQQQLAPNCPGTAVEFVIAADEGNADPVLVGAASSLGGPLTQDNYAFKLTASSPPRIYRSTYPGTSTPIGELQVLAASSSVLHVEVQS